MYFPSRSFEYFTSTIIHLLQENDGFGASHSNSVSQSLRACRRTKPTSVFFLKKTLCFPRAAYKTGREQLFAVGLLLKV